MTTELKHSWTHLDEEYSITEGWWQEPDAPMLAVKIPGISAENVQGKVFDVGEIYFQLDEETARRFHRLIGSWLEEIHE